MAEIIKMFNFHFSINRWNNQEFQVDYHVVPGGGPIDSRTGTIEELLYGAMCYLGDEGFPATATFSKDVDEGERGLISGVLEDYRRRHVYSNVDN